MERSEETKRELDFSLNGPLKNESIEKKFSLAISMMETEIVFLKTLEEEVKPDDEVNKKVKYLRETLQNLKDHISFVEKVYQTNDEDQICALQSEHEKISCCYEKLTNKTDLSIHSIDFFLEFTIKNLLTDVYQTCDKLYKKKKEERVVEKKKKKFNKLSVLAAKLETALEYFPLACIFDKDDILAQDRESPIWERMNKVANKKEITNKDQFKKSLNDFYKLIRVGTAIIAKSEENPDSLRSYLSTAAGAVRYGLFQEKAEAKASLFIKDAKLENAFKLWRLLDSDGAKKLMKLRLPFIEFDRRMYIDRLFPEITAEVILNEYKSNTINKIEKTEMKIKDLTEIKKEIYEKIFLEDSQKIAVRIISPKFLHIRGKKREKLKSWAKSIQGLFSKSNSSDNETPKIIDEIIFHIHGGGFVSMSSATHRNHTIQWANTLNKIIFSVDYRLAPEHPYPAPLDDVWQAYNWVLNYSEDILSIFNEKF